MGYCKLCSAFVCRFEQPFAEKLRKKQQPDLGTGSVL